MGDDGKLIKSVSARQLEGLHYKEMLGEYAANGQSIQHIIQSAKASEQDIEYSWFVPGEKRLETKSAYLKYLPFNGWILVSGVYASEVSDSLKAQRAVQQEKLNADLINTAIVFLIIGGLFVALAWLFTRWLGGRFSARHQALLERQAQLSSQAERMSLNERIVEKATEGIMITNVEGEILHVNQAFSNITGFSKEEVLGEKPSCLASGKHDQRFYENFWQTLQQNGRWDGEIWNRKKDGEVYPQFLKINAYHDAQGQLTNYIGIFQDITTSKNDQKKLTYLTDYDPLTDLPNKRFILDRLQHSLTLLEKHPGETLAVLALDLDHFARINDTLGHEIGDRAIIEITQRFKSVIRDTDILARITGDEFLIVLEPSPAIAQIATQMALRLLEVISRKMDAIDSDVYLTVSIGIALYPEDARTAQDLVKNSLIAVNYAKKNGRNNFQFYKPDMTIAATNRLLIENQLSTALAKHEIKLYYQPQFTTATLVPQSVEALIRWQRQDGSLVSPADFIPIAEESGKILEIGEWVFKQACRQCAKWLAQGIEIPVSVNISVVQLQTDGFVQFVTETLKHYHLPAHLIVIEVTETALMHNEEVALARLQELRKVKINASLDDFGTGYSSLSLLKKAKVSELKIDKSFVDGLPYDSDDLSICASLVSVAHNLGLEVVAEGVETQEQIKALNAMGCNRLQGYYFSKAVSAGEIEKIFRRN